MINPRHLRELIVGPVLRDLRFEDRRLENLIMEAGWIDTRLAHLYPCEHVRNPHGLGLWGISQAELLDLWRWLDSRSNPRRGLYMAAASRYVPVSETCPDASHLVGSLWFATLVAVGVWERGTNEDERWPDTIEQRWRMWRRVWCMDYELLELETYRHQVKHLASIEEPITGGATGFARGLRRRSWQIRGAYSSDEVRRVLNL